MKFSMTIEKSRIFPTIVPRSYVDDVGETSSIYGDVGPNLVVVLTLESDTSLRNVSSSELAEAKITEDEAWIAAWQNFRSEMSEGRLQLQIVDFEDGGKAALFAGHWLASAAVLYDAMYGWFGKELGTNDLYALVSERDSAIIFSGDCSVLVRERVESFAIQAAAGSAKPFGRNLFHLRDDGPHFIAPD